MLRWHLGSLFAVLLTLAPFSAGGRASEDGAQRISDVVYGHKAGMEPKPQMMAAANRVGPRALTMI